MVRAPFGIDEPRTVNDGSVCRRCNDDGPGGLCTCCGRLHTVTIVPACMECYGPVRRPGDSLCETCTEANLE
jgi:hypothetical protein